VDAVNEAVYEYAGQKFKIPYSGQYLRVDERRPWNQGVSLGRHDTYIPEVGTVTVSKS
jgi:hypothetical protein